jgi:hypothetical protein
MRIACSLLAAIATALFAGGATGATQAPKLRITVELPLTLTGTAFRSHELVRVQAIGTFGSRSLRVRTTEAGRLRARFARLSGDPCTLRRVIAVGARGSRAVLRLPPGACQPPEGPPPG